MRDALQRQAASESAPGLSPAEHTLLVACNFWYATNTGQVLGELAADPIGALVKAQAAFHQLGAVRVASTLRAAVAQLNREDAPVSLRQTVAHIEEALSRTDDRVDDLIASFAMDRMNSPDAGRGQRK